VKKVNFSNISIKNFLSIGKEEVLLDFKKGTCLITGENKDNGGRNGVGKSSLIESIYWTLFGSTIRDIKKDRIVHNQSKGGTSVILNFSIEDGKESNRYKITRSLEPSKLLLEKYGDVSLEDISLSTMPKTDEYIKQLIGANEEVFQNAVIMTANNTMPFMAQKKIDKRKFVEGILNLGIFGEMLLKTRADYNEKKKENEFLAKDFTSEQRILEFLKNSKDGFDENKTERIESIKNKINTTNKDLVVLKDKNIPEITDIKEKIKKNEEKIEKFQELLKETNKEIVEFGQNKSDASVNINQARKEKQKILDKGGTCPTCNREYCVEDLEYVKSEIEKLNEIITINQPIYDENHRLVNEKTEFGSKITKNIDILKREIKDYNEEISNSALHEQKIRSLNEKIGEYLENIEEIKKEEFKDDKKIEDAQKKIESLEKNISDLQKQLLVLETAKFVVSEEGVKTFIVKKMLSILNRQLNFYLKTLDAPCTCDFNEMFEETIYNTQGKECSYFNFSGGERKRIDIAILFMFQDILRMQTGVAFNLSMYDELFDSALDEKGVNKILELLKERTDKYDEAIYIISHNKAAVNANFDNMIKLQKMNGKTSIVA
jgi:DNA repair exonuclease SbcCD ATPase subunit